jgi:hypothetical protein
MDHIRKRNKSLNEAIKSIKVLKDSRAKIDRKDEISVQE